MSLLLKTYLQRYHTFGTYNIYLVEMKDMFLSTLCRSSTYIWCVNDLDLRSTINFLQGSTKLDKTQHKTSSLCGRFFDDNIWPWWEIQYHRGDKLLIFFWIFVRKFLKYFAKRSKLPFITPYLIHQLLRWHAFPMIDCSQVIGKARNKE